MPPHKLPVKDRSSLAYARTLINSGKSGMDFGESEKEDIGSLRESSSLDQRFTNWKDQSAGLGKPQPNDKARHLAEARERMRTDQEKAHQPSAKPVLVPGAKRK